MGMIFITFGTHLVSTERLRPTQTYDDANFVEPLWSSFAAEDQPWYR